MRTILAALMLISGSSTFAQSLTPETVMQGGLKYATRHMGLKVVWKKFTGHQETGDLFSVEQRGRIELSDGRTCKGYIRLSRSGVWTYGSFNCIKGGGDAKNLYYDLEVDIPNRGPVKYSFRKPTNGSAHF